MTVGELKKLLDGISDDAPITVRVYSVHIDYEGPLSIVVAFNERVELAAQEGEEES